MRADLLPRTVLSSRLAGLTLIALAVAGCKTEKDPDQPTLIGAPPATAYLGVEYYYNWGAYGGESILDYSLTNAPSWLALEDTSNKARQGIIMRGVPGLSGGNRGDADLGKRENIEVIGTDGRMSGFQPFDIEVKRNVLSAEASEVTEGEALEVKDPSDAACAVPDLEPTGEHAFDLNVYIDDGSFDTSNRITKKTYRTYAKVELDQPSVTRIAIAFELGSDFNPYSCDSNFTAPHKNCEYSTANTGRAIIGQDIVARGSNSAAPTDENGNLLSYVTYQQNSQGVYDRGVLTLEPGITECYIPLEVVDDRIPEPSELASIRLTEVRSGIAALGASDTEVKAGITIADNEPVVSVQTLNGGKKDAINADGEPDIAKLTAYKAILSGEREGEVRVKFDDARDSGAQLGTHYEIVGPNDVVATELVFPVGKNEIEFRIRGNAYTLGSDDGFDDRFLRLGVDNFFQAGKEGYARGENESLLRVNLNQLVTAQTFSGGFTPTDIALGHNGRLFVAGYTASEAEVRIFDQAATLLQAFVVAPGVTGTDIYIDVADRLDISATPRQTYYELAVGYSAPGLSGGEDVNTAFYRFDGTSYQSVWASVFETGSAADDLVRWVGLTAESSKPVVMVAGETSGSWGEQSPSGGADVFLAEIKDESGAAALSAVSLVGSNGADKLLGGSTNISNAVLFGQAPVSVDGTGSVGPFFASGRAASGPALFQVGQDQTEQLNHGVYGAGYAWLVGNASGIAYSITEVEGEDNQLARSQELNSQAGFVWGVNTSGEPGVAYTINDPADSATETLSRSVLFDGDILVAGNTDGEFEAGVAAVTGNDGILARRSTEEEAAYRNWSTQLPQAIEFLDLVNYRDDEVLALVEVAGIRQLLVFSPEGKLLTPVAP